MARKKEVKTVAQTVATEPETKAVRLDLDIESHRQLRLEAAKMELPMAVVVRGLVEEWLKTKKGK
jgi:hypothetical protein